ncbi:hypothetical protein NPS49_04335 [Pseudomonas putida]|uniref:hypothetical protein n=1 Tax=Pseudomonas TaxID=286 RepID=UPI0008636141|nr:MULTISPECIES: hypothetical protein [Pseudomonas]MDD2067545.1 hypothetical protein [Pseudomonas putida]HDS1740213.1 hypothetical protein [Pseudomonas putida]
MSGDNIYLEVLKGSGAILSYFLELPTTQPIAVDYIEATREELTYLSALADHILPVGTVVSLAHLEAHRSRVKEAKATKAAQHIAATRKATQKPSQSATVVSSKPATNNAAKFKSGLKPIPNKRK